MFPDRSTTLLLPAYLLGILLYKLQSLNRLFNVPARHRLLISQRIVLHDGNVTSCHKGPLDVEWHVHNANAMPGKLLPLHQTG